MTDVDPGPYLEQLGGLTLASAPGTVDGAALRRPAPAPAFGTADPRWR